VVSLREREGLIARIRQIRRTEGASGEPATAGSGGVEGEAVRALEARISHLEQLLQGLQDSVHREATRQGKRIADLEARIEPAELARAVSRDARDRGLER
jgi:hypothetical protein